MKNIILTKNKFRLFSLVPIVFCASLLGYALYVEYVDFLMPCSLCIMQRAVFFVIAVLFLIGLIKPVLDWGRKLVAILVSLLAFTGMGISGYHVWLQGLPPEEVPDCGPGLYYMLDTMPFFDAISNVFKSSGSCAEVNWNFLGLSMPAWTLLCYLGLFIFAIVWAQIKVER